MVTPAAAEAPRGRRGKTLKLDLSQRSEGHPRALNHGAKGRPMRAVTARDKAISIEAHPDPQPQAGELLVRVRAAGLNGADVLQMKGMYPAPAGSPQDILGMEFAGEVAEAGPGVQRFEVGDR